MAIGVHRRTLSAALLLVALGAGPTLAKLPVCLQGTYQYPFVDSGIPDSTQPGKNLFYDYLFFENGRAFLWGKGLSTCSTDIVSVRATAKRTRLRARWCTCADGEVRVSALLAPDSMDLSKRCENASGTVTLVVQGQKASRTLFPDAACVHKDMLPSDRPPDFPDCLSSDDPDLDPGLNGARCPVGALVLAAEQGGRGGVVVIPAGGGANEVVVRPDGGGPPRPATVRNVKLPKRRAISWKANPVSGSLPTGNLPSLLFTRKISFCGDHRVKDIAGEVCCGDHLVPPGGACPDMSAPYPPYVVSLPEAASAVMSGNMFNIDLPDGNYAVDLENDCTVAATLAPASMQVEPNIHELTVKGSAESHEYHKQVNLSPRDVFPLVGIGAGLPSNDGFVSISGPMSLSQCQTPAIRNKLSSTGAFSLSLPEVPESESITLVATSGSSACPDLYSGTLPVRVPTTTLSPPVGATTTTTILTITPLLQTTTPVNLTDRYGNKVPMARVIPGDADEPVFRLDNSNAPCLSDGQGNVKVPATAVTADRLLAVPAQLDCPLLASQLLPQPCPVGHTCSQPQPLALREGVLLGGALTGLTKEERKSVTAGTYAMTAYGFERVRDPAGGLSKCVVVPEASVRVGFAKGGLFYSANVLPAAGQPRGGCTCTTVTTSLTLPPTVTTSTSTSTSTTIPTGG